MSHLDEKMEMPNFIFGSPNLCTYCGDIPSEIDHVIPLSQYIDRKRSRSDDSRGIRTYSCRNCNSVLSNKYFSSFIERVMFTREQIIKKAQKFKRDASWSDEEISQLDHTLRTFVANRQIQQRLADKRTEWAFSPSFYRNLDTIKNAKCLQPDNPKYKQWVYDYFYDSVYSNHVFK
jgi:hypothetical protein